MRTILRIVILLLSYSYAYSAYDEVILNPRGTLITQRIINYKDYDDIRIDRDLDGKVDEWYLRKGNMEIHVRYNKGNISTVLFKMFKGSNVSVKEYTYVDNTMILINSEERPMLVMHGEVENEACEAQQKILTDKVTALNEDISAILSNTAAEKKSCDLSSYPKFSKRLSILLRDIANNPTKFTSCIAEQPLESIDSKLVSARLTSTLAKMSADPTASGKFFTCGYSDGENVVGTTTEDGRIRIDFPKEGEDPPVGLIPMFKLIYHELTHSAGVASEDSIHQLLASCLEVPGDPRAGLKKKPTTMNMVPMTSGHAERAADNISRQEANTKTAGRAEVEKSTGKRAPANAANTKDPGLNMKSEIANAKAIIPSAEKLNVAKSDKSPAGKEQALRESAKESAPLLRTANQVMGVSNTPAMADSSNESNDSNYSPPPPRSSRSSSSYSSSSSGGGDAYSGTSTYSESEVSGSGSGSGSSSSGRRYQSRHGRYQSKGSSDGGVGSDEFIAEEVDLTKGTNSRSSASTRRAPAANQNDTRPYVSAAQENSTNSREPASTTDEISKGRRSRPVASGGSDSFVPSSSGGGSSINLGSSSGSSGGSGAGGGASASTTSSARNTAKAATQSRAPASVVKGSPAQKQMMSTIVDSNYDETIRKIRNDRQFQEELINNSIKVIDNYGGSWGAPDGSVIYQATGNGFVRQR